MGLSQLTSLDTTKQNVNHKIVYLYFKWSGVISLFSLDKWNPNDKKKIDSSYRKTLMQVLSY